MFDIFVMANACFQNEPVQSTAQEEEEDSDYEYEYETDSEYEFEYEEEENKDLDEGKGLHREVAEASGVVKIHPVCIEPVEYSPVQQLDKVADDSEAKRLAEKARIESLKPKLPAYVTSPEPCAFSEDPCRWINWMEDQVTKERERRLKSRLDAVADMCEPEVNLQQPAQKAGSPVPIEDNGKEIAEVNEADNANDDVVDLTFEETNDHSTHVFVTDAWPGEVEKKFHHEEDHIQAKMDMGTEHGDDDGSEWEYDTEEDKAAEEENQICDKTGCDTTPPMFRNGDCATGENMQNYDTEESKLASPETDEINPKSKKVSCQVIVEESDEPSALLCSDKPSGDIQKSASANPETALGSKEFQADSIIHQKEASNNVETGKKTDMVGPGTGLLDAETQRKLTFIRQKKAAAAAARSGQSESSISPRASQDISENSFSRQISCPERTSMASPLPGPSQTRPQSIANDASLNDMLARIKTLREERKQILQDMSAIKNAFSGTQSISTPPVNPDDDGIGSGNNTPCQEYGEAGELIFTDDSFRSGAGTTSVSNFRQRVHRRSIDSGIGSKSLCSSIQDGSPTAELDSVSSNSSVDKIQAMLGCSSSRAIDPHRRRISKEAAAAVTSPDDIHTCDMQVYYCYICGENLGGRLTKGAVMHLGLEDGEPVCADYLYLTEESKERIRQVATTKMFDHEAKFQLLDTLDLQAWNVDYDNDEDMPTARNVMDKVDAFLEDIEMQKQRDKERFNAMRSGAIDDVLNEEFADLLLQKQEEHELSSASSTRCNSTDRSFGSGETEQSYQNNHHQVQTSPAPPLPPPPPPPLHCSSVQTLCDSAHAGHQAVLQGIRAGGQRLRHTETTDRSEEQEGLGQVIHRHLAPIVFNRDIRSLVKDIAKDDHRKRLKKVRTVDKSKPYIPDDVQIYFYGAPNADNKAAPPPPLSRLKFESSCLKR